MITIADTVAFLCKEYAWDFTQARMTDDVTAANARTSDMVCEAQLTLMDMEKRLDLDRYVTLNAMIAKAIDGWRNADDWRDRTMAANLVIRAYWEVQAVVYPDLPHALPVVVK